MLAKLKVDDNKFNQTGLLQMNKTDKVRATARISINDLDNFVKFDVQINDVPIELDKTGKDIVVDWYLMDDFDTNKTFWVDSNGLEMVKRDLYKRKDYNFSSGNGTIAGNYYPVTSAIAVRDHNTTTPIKPNKTAPVGSSSSKGKSGGGNSTNNTKEEETGPRDLSKKQKQVVIMNDRS